MTPKDGAWSCDEPGAREVIMSKLRIAAVVFGLLLVVGYFLPEQEKELAEGGIPDVNAVPENQALRERLVYLERIEEVAWVQFDRNNVYIGFRNRPEDLAAVVNAAAVLGNKAHGFGVHVWAFDSRYTGWRPGDGPYYCEATARRGKLTDECD